MSSPTRVSVETGVAAIPVTGTMIIPDRWVVTIEDWQSLDEQKDLRRFLSERKLPCEHGCVYGPLDKPLLLTPAAFIRTMSHLKLDGYEYEVEGARTADEAGYPLLSAIFWCRVCDYRSIADVIQAGSEKTVAFRKIVLPSLGDNDDLG